MLRTCPWSGFSSPGERSPPLFQDDSFDVVISVVGAMFAPHHRQTVDEMLVCGPGGTIAMINWTPQGLIGNLFKTREIMSKNLYKGTSTHADRLRACLGRVHANGSWLPFDRAPRCRNRGPSRP